MNQLKIPDDGIILLSVGELNKNKNHATVIKALAQLKDDRLHYCIAGIGALEDTLREMAKDNNVNLHLLGYCDDMQKLMCVSDIFIHSSSREGLSVALMEAMANGLPCIVSKIRGNIDLIDDGKGGFLCNVFNSNEYVGAIRSVCRNESICQKMGDYNRNKIKKFDITNIKKEIIRIYENILGENANL